MSLESYLDIAPKIKAALDAGEPVVALESTIISHGMPYPQNVQTAEKVEQIVRENGAHPATIAVLGGRLKVGLDNVEINYLGKQGVQVTKTSRRDLPFIIARKIDGATTVAATMIIAELAGISIFATGGIGGVHRGAEQSMDISADLPELARTNVAVISAGVKSILDLPLTLEYLETHGVPVVGFQTDEFPAFYSRTSGLKVDCRVDTVQELAAALKAKWELGLSGGMVIANPIPENYAMQFAEINPAIEQAVREAEQQEIKGKEITPFLLEHIKIITAGKSLKANIQLVYNNAALAARLAKELRGFVIKP